MATDEDKKKISEYLTRCKITVQKTSKEKVDGMTAALCDAVDAARAGKKADVKKHVKTAAIVLYKTKPLTDQNTANDWAKVAVKFALATGAFKPESLLKKNKARFAKLTSVFRTKGAKTAQKATVKLHSDLLKSGELPRTFSQRDLSDLLKDDSLPDVFAPVKNIVGNVQYKALAKKHKLDAGAEATLKDICADVWNDGPKSQKAKKAAAALLKGSPNAKASPDALVDDIYEAMIDAAV